MLPLPLVSAVPIWLNNHALSMELRRHIVSAHCVGILCRHIEHMSYTVNSLDSTSLAEQIAIVEKITLIIKAKTNLNQLEKAIPDDNLCIE